MQEREKLTDKKGVIELFGELRKVNTPGGMEQIIRTAKASKDELKKQHTFNLTESVFEDFKLLASLDEITLNDYIDKLIADEVNKHREFIDSVKMRRDK